LKECKVVAVSALNKIEGELGYIGFFEEECGLPFSGDEVFLNDDESNPGSVWMNREIQKKVAQALQEPVKRKNQLCKKLPKAEPGVHSVRQKTVKKSAAAPRVPLQDKVQVVMGELQAHGGMMSDLLSKTPEPVSDIEEKTGLSTESELSSSCDVDDKWEGVLFPNSNLACEDKAKENQVQDVKDDIQDKINRFEASESGMEERVPSFLFMMSRVLEGLGRAREAIFVMKSWREVSEKHAYGDDCSSVAFYFPGVPRDLLTFEVCGTEDRYRQRWIHFLSNYQLVGGKWEKLILGVKTKKGIFFTEDQKEMIKSRDQEILIEELNLLIKLDQDVARICAGTDLLLECEAFQCTHFDCSHTGNVTFSTRCERRSFSVLMSKLSLSMRARILRQEGGMSTDQTNRVIGAIKERVITSILDRNSVQGVAVMLESSFNITVLGGTCVAMVHVGRHTYPVKFSSIAKDSEWIAKEIEGDNPCTVLDLKKKVIKLLSQRGRVEEDICVYVCGFHPLLGDKEDFSEFVSRKQKNERLLIGWKEVVAGCSVSFGEWVRPWPVLGFQESKRGEFVRTSSLKDKSVETTERFKRSIILYAKIISRNRSKRFFRESESPWPRKERDRRLRDLEDHLQHQPQRSSYQIVCSLERDFQKIPKAWFSFWEDFVITLRFFLPMEVEGLNQVET